MRRDWLETMGKPLGGQMASSKVGVSHAAAIQMTRGCSSRRSWRESWRARNASLHRIDLHADTLLAAGKLALARGSSKQPD